MFYHFNFDTQANFDDAEYSQLHEGKPHSLPTTTHNSPGSEESSLDLSLQSDDCSFQNATQTAHAANIWSASVEFLKGCVKGTVDEERGFNGFNVPSSGVGLEEAIKANQLLRSRERSKFLQQLQRESELCGLLTELMLLFSVPVFQELLFVVHNIWQRHYLPYRQSKASCGFLPQFAAFVGWAGEERQMERVQELSGDAGEVRRAAEEGMEQLARELFYSKKLRVLTMQGKFAVRDRRAVEGNFLIFIRAVARGVFLSAQGFYEDETLTGIFSEEEEMSCEGFELQGNRFVRALSQIQEDLECLHLSSKRRKQL